MVAPTIAKFRKYDHYTKIEKQIEELKGKYNSNNSNKDVKIINNCKRCGRNHKINNCPAFGIKRDKVE